MCKVFITRKISSHACFIYMNICAGRIPSKALPERVVGILQKKRNSAASIHILGPRKGMPFSFMAIGHPFSFVTMNFEGACCKATACMCNLGWHERFYWLLTYLQCTKMVSPSKLQLTVALRTCKLDYSPVVTFEKITQWGSSCMHMTIFSLGTTTIWDWGKSVNSSWWFWHNFKL